MSTPVGQDVDADRPHFPHRARVEGMEDLQVVDHQVQHNVDIQATRAELRHPLNFDEAGHKTRRQHSLNGGIVELDMAHRQHHPARGGGCHQRVRLVQGGGDRLLHQNVDPGLDQTSRDFKVIHGRHGDHRDIDGLSQRLESRGDQSAVLVRRVPCGGGIRVNHEHRLGTEQVRQQANVMAPHHAGADNPRP